MSTLLVDELFTSVIFEQRIRIMRSAQIGAIRLWIYKNGNLDNGDLRMQIYDGATLLKQVDISHTDINNAVVLAYAHGYIRFDTDGLSLNVGETEAHHEYILKFSMVNYTDNANKYIAVCREWDGPKYVTFDGPIENDSEDPAGLEIYAYRG